MFQETTCDCIEMKFISDLRRCMPGGGSNARSYERICADILRYLFKDEFSLALEQSRSENGSQIMDLQCALRGTTDCWRSFREFYKTKFVVFEFKNYTGKIQQNQVYVTRKYLHRPICRNMAFIVSRKGFSRNAHLAAMNMLQEGLIVVDLCDDDLIEMLMRKQRGEEPSTYLDGKVNRLLMSYPA